MFNVCIAFNGGSYGTFIEWCLHYFSNAQFSDDLPFLKSGSSHNYKGIHLGNTQNLKKFVSDATNSKDSIVRFHPKVSREENIVDNIKFAKENFQKVIFLHPTNDSILWNINNKFEKIWEHGWLEHNNNEIVENISQWGYENICNMSPWEKREFLSFYIYKQHADECGLNSLNDIKTNIHDIMCISIEELRDNFYSTIENILSYCELEFTKKDAINFIYDNWIKLQFHKDKDQYVKTIVDAIVNDRDFTWDKQLLTLIDESFIQMKLRNNNIEIKCFELNEFPNSVKKLKPLLYAA